MTDQRSALGIPQRPPLPKRRIHSLYSALESNKEEPALESNNEEPLRTFPTLRFEWTMQWHLRKWIPNDIHLSHSIIDECVYPFKLLIAS